MGVEEEDDGVRNFTVADRELAAATISIWANRGGGAARKGGSSA